MNTMRTATCLVAAAMMMAGLAGCSATADDDATPSSEPIILTIGTDDEPGVPSADQIEFFAAQVADLSKGSITVEPKWKAAGEDQPDWDQAVARLVMDRTLDMGLIPTRAWDALGVTSLEPLNAPFLIQSDDATAAVIAESSSELMAGLGDARVEGIALFPEGLRRLFGYDAPIVTAAALEGATLRIPTSNVSKAMYESLGATTVDGEPDPATQLGRESSFLLVQGGSAPVTGNVIFYPKVNALVIGENAASELSDGQRDILDQAAASTLAHVVDTQPNDSEAARTFCAEGGTIALAEVGEVDAMKAATARVTDDIASHGENAAVLESIRAIAAQHPGEPVTACTD